MNNFEFKNKDLKPFHHIAIALLFFLLLNSFSLHKYYASITKLELDTTNNLIKSYTVLFVDDMERLLEERYQLQVTDFNHLQPKEREIITQYLSSKVSFSVNRKPLKIEFLGSELENQQLHLYYQAIFTETIQRLELKNELLMDLYDQQHNTIDVIFDNTVKSVHLNSSKRKATLYY